MQQKSIPITKTTRQNTLKAIQQTNNSQKQNHYYLHLINDSSQIFIHEDPLLLHQPFDFKYTLLKSYKDFKNYSKSGRVYIDERILTGNRDGSPDRYCHKNVDQGNINQWHNNDLESRLAKLILKVQKNEVKLDKLQQIQNRAQQKSINCNQYKKCEIHTLSTKQVTKQLNLQNEVNMQIGKKMDEINQNYISLKTKMDKIHRNSLHLQRKLHCKMDQSTEKIKIDIKQLSGKINVEQIQRQSINTIFQSKIQQNSAKIMKILHSIQQKFLKLGCIFEKEQNMPKLLEYQCMGLKSSEHNVYYIDNEGYLSDDNNFYLMDQNNEIIQFSDRQLGGLKQYFGVIINSQQKSNQTSSQQNNKQNICSKLEINKKSQNKKNKTKLFNNFQSNL